MKRKLFFAAVIVFISGCGDSRSIQERKSRLMYDCRCEPGTYEYSYRLGGLLIEEQNAAKYYFEQNKGKIIECTKITNTQHEMLIKKIDEYIEFNKNLRPHYLKNFLFGGSQVMSITRYKDAQLDSIIKEVEGACAKLKSTNSSLDSVEYPTPHNPGLSMESTEQSAPKSKKEPTSEALQSGDKKLMGDRIDDNPNAAPNTKEDAANKAANRSWQDQNGFIHYPDGSASNGPVD